MVSSDIGVMDKSFDGRPEMVPFSDVRRETLAWLWPGRLPRGKLVMMAGDPGLGKSFLTMDIAARISSGRGWPDVTVKPGVGEVSVTSDDLQGAAPFDVPPQGEPDPDEAEDVVVLSAEDDPGDTIRPRLEDAGADLRRVHLITGVFWTNCGLTTELRMDRDIKAIGLALRRCKRPALVIIDPITAYMGKVDANSNAEVRRMLAKLSGMAEQTRATVLCVTHLNKASQNKMVYRSMGSLAFTAAARLAWPVARDPNRPDMRVLTPIKSNISGAVPGLRFRVTEKDGAPGPTIEYEVSAQPVTLDDLEAAGDQPQEPGELEEAVSWLREALRDGAMGAKEVMRQAKEMGMSSVTVRRAKRQAGVRVEKSKEKDGPWMWRLDG